MALFGLDEYDVEDLIAEHWCKKVSPHIIAIQDEMLKRMKILQNLIERIEHLEEEVKNLKTCHKE